MPNVFIVTCITINMRGKQIVLGLT